MPYTIASCIKIPGCASTHHDGFCSTFFISHCFLTLINQNIYAYMRMYVSMHRCATCAFLYACVVCICIHAYLFLYAHAEINTFLSFPSMHICFCAYICIGGALHPFLCYGLSIPRCAYMSNCVHASKRLCIVMQRLLDSASDSIPDHIIVTS